MKRIIFQFVFGRIYLGSIFFIFFLLCIACSGLQAQRLVLSHTDFIGGYHRGVFAFSFRSVRPTLDGGCLIVTGTCDSGTGDIPHSLTHAFMEDSSDVLLIKLDSFGNKQWIKTYGTINDETAADVCQTPDGGFAVLIPSTKRLGDFAFDRLDADGNYLWTSPNYGSSRGEGVGEIIATSDHGFLMAGISYGADGDIPFNYQMPIGGMQPPDWVLLKTDSLGQKQWVKILGTSDDDLGPTCILSDGQYYYFLSSTVTLDHDCVDSLRLAQHSKAVTPYVFKLDTAGNVIWVKAFGIGNVNRAMFDPRDSTIVGIADGIPGYGIEGGHGRHDIMLFKVSREGQLLWGRLYGGSGNEMGRAGSLQMGPNGGYYVVGENNSGPAGGYGDAWLFLTDSVGNELANNFFGGVGYDGPIGVVETKNGVAAIGHTNSYLFREGSGHNYVTPFPKIHNIENIFVSHFEVWPLEVSGATYQAKRLKVYPNPARQQINILLPVDASSGQLSCVNTAGQLIYQQRTAQNAAQPIVVQAATWPSGIYTISWQSDNSPQIYRARVVVQ
ncbi:MAG: T9SS type A sorting domain-containing protein [Bacteroidetes bacterium]|nr:T9SS type A sorting domain-containing protein [Bacteroidota bacterium]